MPAHVGSTRCPDCEALSSARGADTVAFAARITSLEAELEKVRAERDEARAIIERNEYEEVEWGKVEYDVYHFSGRALAAEAARDDALRRLGEAVEALKPFAIRRKADNTFSLTIAVEHYERAAALVQREKAGKERGDG